MGFTFKKFGKGFAKGLGKTFQPIGKGFGKGFGAIGEGVGSVLKTGAGLMKSIGGAYTGLLKTLSNPIVLIGGGVIALIVLTKMK